MNFCKKHWAEGFDYIKAAADGALAEAKDRGLLDP